MMTPSEREKWLELRKTGIGGSEVAALLSDQVETKYACKRRLWLEKSGVPADEEFDDTAPVRLGRLFEGPICEIYSHITGRDVEEIPRQVHPDHPYLGVSVDRIVRDKQKGVGVLEAKNMLSRTFFETRRTGVPVDYLAQVQHGILVASAALDVDINYGSFVVGRSDDPRLVAFAVEWHLKMNPQVDLSPNYLIHFDVPRDQAICDAILREGPAFWQTLKNPALAPERLEIDSPKCQRCRWAQGCQGPALLPAEDDTIPVVDELMPLVQEYIERESDLDRAKQMVDETKEVVMAILGERQAARVHVDGKLKNIYWRKEAGSILYKEAVEKMAAQYNVMKQRLIDMNAEGADLIPPPSNFLRRGKDKRPLRMQYVLPKKSTEDDE